jgi:hypothetical protein
MPKYQRVMKGLGWLGMAICIAGWATMWSTSQTIWSIGSPLCTAYSNIELKGHVYKTCSFLADRYMVGQYAFFGGFLTLCLSEPLRRKLLRKRSTNNDLKWPPPSDRAPPVPHAPAP